MDLLAIPIQAALAVAVIAALTALTALAVTRSLVSRTDEDSVFWYGFTGFFAVIAAISVAAATIPGAGPWIAGAGVLGAGIAGGWIWRGEHERGERRRRSECEKVRSALRGRHEAVLQQWVSYELDVGAAIEFPAMTDLSRPETAHLIRSMRQAAVLREQADDDGRLPDGYSAAVGALEVAFDAAERAAGVVRRLRG
ncbi:hypothetical protein [Arthrobacter sp. H5]|uniref:hypothetical protein n=1 Tax=Arthrobacter sp. H5 TaxID=1267973 RepID=UPI0004B30CA1|nr:hypothetical protein [Arthrobacter sp. H5]